MLRRPPGLRELTMRLIGALATVVASGLLTSCSSGADVPAEPLTLSAFASARPGEVILEWSGGPSGFPRWEYRISRPFSDEGEWQDIPLGGSYSRTHRVSGLDVAWRQFSLRPRPDWTGEAFPEATVLGSALSAGPDGIVRTEGLGIPLERGGTFRIGRSAYVVTVPEDGVFSGNFGEFGTYHLTHDATGSAIVIDRRTGWDPEGWARGSYEYRVERAKSPQQRDAYSLLGEMRDSIRYVPYEPRIWPVVSGEADHVFVQWFTARGVGPWEYRFGRLQPPSGGRESAAWGRWRSLPSRSSILRAPMDPGESTVDWLIEARPRTQDQSGESQVLRLQPPGIAPDGLPQLDGSLLHEGGHVYRLREGYLLEIPRPMLLRAEHYGVLAELGASSHGLSTPGAAVRRTLLMDEPSGSYVLLDGQTHEVIERKARPHPGGVNTDAMLDTLVGSIRYSPWEFGAPLLAVAGGAVGEVILQWKPLAEEVTHWQYRYREVLYDSSGKARRGFWTVWTDVPGGASTTSHRLTELAPGAVHSFEVRPHTATGVGAVSGANGWSPPAGPEGLPLGRSLLEGGRTFGLTESPIVFDVPDGALLFLRVGALDSDDAGNPARVAIIRDVESGSYLWIMPSAAAGSQRYVGRHAEAGVVDALFDRILESVRR